MSEKLHIICKRCKGPLVNEPLLSSIDNRYWFCPFCNRYYKRLKTIWKWKDYGDGNGSWYGRHSAMEELGEEWTEHFKTLLKTLEAEPKLSEAPYCLVRRYPIESKIVPDANFLDWFRNRNRDK